MNILQKLSKSIINASKGQESFGIVIWLWGGISYFIGFFVLDDVNKLIKKPSFLALVLMLIIIFFIWHIFITIRCAPKLPKLSKEEQEIAKIKNGGITNSLIRKLFLQEPISKMNPRNILIILDLYFILHYASLF